MIEPLVVEFTVATSPSHAFDMWANRTALWWPRGHTMGDSDDYEIIFEGRPGGRVYERIGDGTEHEWGEVLDWDPPHRIRYLWHLFFDRSEATTVEVRFAAAGEADTTVTLTQNGFERLGDAGVTRRERTGSAWAELGRHYEAACAASESG